MDAMGFPLERYYDQQARLPHAGCHFIASTAGSTLAQGSEIVVVYQAFKPEIAQWAATHQCLSACKEFSLTRMTWIKPGFMWMMYRSGWATKPNQEHILAVQIRKSWLLDTLRTKSVLSLPENSGKTKGQQAVVQWDPDHDVQGHKLDRRTIQIGLRGAAAAEYAAGTQGPAVVKIQDVTPYVCCLRDVVMQLGEKDSTVGYHDRSVQDLAAGQARPAAATHNTATAGSDASAAAAKQQLLVPVEEVLKLDAELCSVLGMDETSSS